MYLVSLDCLLYQINQVNLLSSLDVAIGESVPCYPIGEQHIAPAETLHHLPSLINPIAPAGGSPVPPVLSFKETCVFDLGKGEKGVLNLGWTKRADATLPQGLL